MSLKAITIGGMCLAAAGLAAPAHAGEPCSVFLDQGAFEDFCLQNGKLVNGIEDFEPPIGDVPFGVWANLSQTLQANVPNIDFTNGYGFPAGLLNTNLVIQSNALGANAPVPEPGSLLAALGRGYYDGQTIPNSIVVRTQLFTDSLDLIFLPDVELTGVGFDVLDPNGLHVAHIAVFDQAGAEIAKQVIPVGALKTFFGIWCPQPIGRINIAGLDPGGAASTELVDNIQMWVEGPAPACPWDCALPGDKMVSVVDFLALLAAWGQTATPCDFDGGGVGVTDFLEMLAMWGPCPMPTHDECSGQEPVDLLDPDFVAAVHFDMYGATPSLVPFACLPAFVPRKDVWYCLENATGQTIGVSLTTSIALFIEASDGCGCPPGPVLACGDGLMGTEQFVMQPEQHVLVRLINWLDLPNDELRGSLFITCTPIVVETVEYFRNPEIFYNAVFEAGKVAKFWWDFTPHDQPPFVPALNDPLDINTHGLNPDDPWTDAGDNLWPSDVDNVQFSSNTTPPGPLTPHGEDSVSFIHPGNYDGMDNAAVIATWSGHSLDIICGPPAGDHHTALALEIVSVDVNGPAPSTIRVTVYDENDDQMGQYVLDYPGGKAFLGILTVDPALAIGRVDIWDVNARWEGVSSIQPFWQPPPVP